jgi:hypothetical protein
MIPLSMTRLYDFACAKRRAISAPVAFHTVCEIGRRALVLPSGKPSRGRRGCKIWHTPAPRPGATRDTPACFCRNAGNVPFRPIWKEAGIPPARCLYFQQQAPCGLGGYGFKSAPGSALTDAAIRLGYFLGALCFESECCTG